MLISFDRLQGDKVICRVCQAVITPFGELRRVANPESRKLAPVFRITDVPGLSFIGMRQDVLCRNGHSVGMLDNEKKTVNVASNIRILKANGKIELWDDRVWQHIP